MYQLCTTSQLLQRLTATTLSILRVFIDNLEIRPGYIRYRLGHVGGRSVTTNDNSTNMDADKKIHCYENAISGISVPFYCNIVSS